MTPSPSSARLHQVDSEGGLPVAWRDRDGSAIGSAAWRDDTLEWARFRVPGGGEVEIRGGGAEHPILGPCDRLRAGAAEALCTAVDWARPRAIPALDRPGALAAGAGTAVLNFLAEQAAAAGQGALRYRGPYPSAALFSALADSFAVAGDASGAAERFCSGGEVAAAAGVMVEPAVAFSPRPFERRFVAAGVCAQLRDQLEVVWVGGRAYRRGGAWRRLGDHGELVRAQVVFGGAVYADVLVCDRSGAVIEGPHPVPAARGGALGAALPPSLRDLLRAALPPRAPILLRPALAQVLEAAPMHFSDTGADPARVDPEGGIAVHAALIDLIADPGQLAAAVCAAVEPVAARLAQAELAAMWERATKA